MFRKWFHILEQLENTLSQTNAGLAALQAAETSLATDVSNAIAEMQTLAAALVTASGDSDSAVAAIASQISAQASALSAAVVAAQPAPAQPAPAPQAPAAS